jgi:hypothetical protein
VCLSFGLRHSRSEFGGLGYLFSGFLGLGMESGSANMDKYLVLCCFDLAWAEGFEHETFYRTNAWRHY